jgi:hypothetical protein
MDDGLSVWGCLILIKMMSVIVIELIVLHCVCTETGPSGPFYFKKCAASFVYVRS